MDDSSRERRANDTSSWVIRRKIVPPPLSEFVVPRRRMETLLTGLIDQHRLVFVYASPGAGKTTAILQAAHRLQRPLVWLDVDSTDEATGRLLVYLEAALALKIPEIDGAASGALAAQIPHAEVAGLLAEAIGDVPVLIVLDDAERLATAPGALDVISSFARYLPANARLVIASRTELPFRSSMGASPWVAAIGEEDLALTVDEATDALAATGRSDIDPVDALVETGGWMTGVLFEAWRATDHVIGLGGEADPLHGYLATEILGQLDPADAEFLVSTAVLGEVTAADAEALGLLAVPERMHSLAGRRLPVSWQRNGTVLRCHPRFREFLLKRLSRRPEADQRQLHRAHAELLIAHNHHEEAVDVYLTAGCLDEAVHIIPPVLERVIERTDFDLAERWLAALDPIRRIDDVLLAPSELMLAVVRERFAAGVQLADRLELLGRRLDVARASPRAAALMAWCYLHAGRVADIEQVVSVAGPGPDRDAARYMLSVIQNEPSLAADPALGQLSGGPLDALVLRIHFDLGRLPLLKVAPTSPWALKAAESWLVSALLADGHTERAFEVYHGLADSTDQSVWLTALLGPRLMSEIGDHAEAWRLLRTGRDQIAATGSVLFESYSLLLEAEFHLRFSGDLGAAEAVLRQLDRHPTGSVYALLVEQHHMLMGLLRLAESRNDEAALALREAVGGMVRGQRLLYLPGAAVYLAEAEWRVGNEESSDSAAELAMTTASAQGSHHHLLKALAEFPDVLTRRIDLEPTGESAWHEAGRALMRIPDPRRMAPTAAVEIAEFGRMAIVAGGTELNPGLNKSVELLAFLANHEREDVAREAVIDALFAGRRGASSASYLRQAVLKLRRTLPEVLDSQAPPGVFRLQARTGITTESRRLIDLLREASAMRGTERLHLLLAALEVADRGSYLPQLGSQWVEERRARLAELVRSARLEAAEVAFTEGLYAQAGALAEAVTSVDPYREAAWRVLMRVALTHGDHDRVIAAYRSCERALAELGAEPSPTTSRLLRDSRR